MREALAHHAAGVVIVSATEAGAWRGLTATTFASVSLDPPLVLVAVDSFAATREAILASRRFGVSVLSSRQQFLADRFSGQAPTVDPQWRDIPHFMGDGRLPLLEGGIAWFECDVRETLEAGDHEVIFGAVTFALRGAGEPLIHWDRGFWRLARL